MTLLIMLLQYGDKLEDTLGLLIWAVAESMKLEMGVAVRFSYSPLFCILVIDTLVKRLWLECVHYRLEIQTDLPDFQAPQSRDIEKMWLFAQHIIQGQELSTLNHCHMQLKAIWLSDICMGLGTEVTQQAWEGQEEAVDSIYHWPICAPTTLAD